MPRSLPTLLLLLAVIAFSGCRVAVDSGGAVPSDGAARADGDAADAPPSAADVDSAAPTAQACDLLLQNCPDRRQACYPDSTFSGATRCLFPGAGGPLSPCLLHEECDSRLICVDIDRDGFLLCTPLCDPGATPTGCEGRAPCRRLTNYSAGTCGL